MRKNLSLKIVVVFLIPLVLVASSVALYSFADVEKGVNEEGLSESDNRDVIKLIPPPFIGVAGAAEVTAGDAFLANEVGIASYTVQVRPSIHAWEVGPGGSDVGRIKKVSGVLTPGTTYTVSATGDPKWGWNGFYLSVFVAAGNKGLGAVPIGGATTTLTAGGPGASDGVAFFIDNGGTSDNSGTAAIIFDDGITSIPFSAHGRDDSSDKTQDIILGRMARVKIDATKSYKISAIGEAKWGDGPDDRYTSVIFSRGNNAYLVPIGGSTTVVSHMDQAGEDDLDFFFLDFGDVTAGEGKDDNSGSITISISEVDKPDLTITDIWWEPENPQSGDEVTFFYTVQNQGTDTPSGFDVRLYLDGFPLAVSAVSSLAAGESKDGSFTCTWTATKGSHTIKVEADSGGDIEEFDDTETSNVMKKVLLVDEVPADITITGIEVTQAIQNLNNDVPLIAGKDTYVLVYTKSDKQVEITGKLFKINGTDRTDPIEQINGPIKALRSDLKITHRANNSSCLQFYLPSEWTQGENIRFEVEVTGGGSTITDETNLLSFEEMPPLEINLVFVKFFDDKRSYISNWADYKVVSHYLNEVYPINHIMPCIRGILTTTLNPTCRWGYGSTRLANSMHKLDEQTTETNENAIWLGLVDPDIPKCYIFWFFSNFRNEQRR